MWEYRATLNRIVDGDTVVLNIDLGFHITVTEKFRLSKINAPEMNTDEGKAAKAYLTSLLPTEAFALRAEVEGQDKYGRWLVSLSLPTNNHLNVNETMMTTGHAVAYSS